MDDASAPPQKPPGVPAPPSKRALVEASPTQLPLPALIADVGDEAAWRYINFFTASIRNPNTRRAYARACAQFFAWCDERGLTLSGIRACDVSVYIEHLQPDWKRSNSNSASNFIGLTSLCDFQSA